MSTDRRTFVAGTALMMAFPTGAAVAIPGDKTMYGLISKITAQSGRRDDLIKILLDGVIRALPGCINYVVATEPSDANSIWVTEVWQSRQAHAASLSVPAVAEALNKGRPLIASFSRIAETRPVGEMGISSSSKD